MSTLQVALLLCALTIVLIAAHTLAAAFLKIRQPAVIGEILAGLLLGPTVFGYLAPGLHAKLLPATGPGTGAFQALSQLGLLLLMFVTGGEMQLSRQDRDRRTVGLVALTGLLLPLVFGVVFARLLDPTGFSGPAGTRLTFGLVFGIAVSVTSIPVISRIMLDLDMLDTALARIVLSVAALEDIVLYAILAVVLSVAHNPSSDAFGLWEVIGNNSTAFSITYHVGASLLFFAAGLFLGPWIVRRLLESPVNYIKGRSPTAFRIMLLLGMVLICALLGINIIFGALLGGFALRRAETAIASDAAVESEGTLAIRQFAVAFFIPIYFASVGLSLNLRHDFDLLFFVWFILLCSAVKLVSVWFGSRLAGQSAARSLDLAVALNGRGGPGIVLATVTLAEGIINERFFTSLVLLSVLTSQFAGFWLERRLPALRAEEAAVTVAELEDQLHTEEEEVAVADPGRG